MVKIWNGVPLKTLQDSECMNRQVVSEGMRVLAEQMGIFATTRIVGSIRKNVIFGAICKPDCSRRFLPVRLCLALLDMER